MKVFRLGVSILLMTVSPIGGALHVTNTGFYYPLGTNSFNTGNGGWLSKDPDYFSREYHLGVDMMAPYDTEVVAIANGTIKQRSESGWGTNNCAAVVEHETETGEVFVSIYGHLQCSLVSSNGMIHAGEVVGKIGSWAAGDHVHFGIHPGPYSTIASSHWGRQFIDGHWTNPCEGNSSCTNGFINPIKFIETHLPKHVDFYKRGRVGWFPKEVSCSVAQRWVLLDTSGNEVIAHATRDICNDEEMLSW